MHHGMQLWFGATLLVMLVIILLMQWVIDLRTHHIRKLVYKLRKSAFKPYDWERNGL